MGTFSTMLAGFAKSDFAKDMAKKGTSALFSIGVDELRARREAKYNNTENFAAPTALPEVTANYKPVVIDSKEHETQTLQEVQSIIRRLKKWPELDASQFSLKPNAFATFAAAATIADGEIDSSEATVISSFAEALGLNPGEMVNATSVAIEKQQGMTLEAFEEKLESIAATQNPTKSILLFTLCTTIIAADEELSKAEKSLLQAFAAVLEINDTQKEKIFGIIEDVTGIIIKL